MNKSISSTSSHMINSLNSSEACYFKSEKDIDLPMSPTMVNQLDAQASPRSISSNDFLKKSIRVDQSQESFQSLPKHSPSNSISKENKKKKKKPRRRITLPPPRILEQNETSKCSELRGDNYSLFRNTVKFFECFEFKRGCLQRVLCKKITILEKIKQLKKAEIEQKYCKRSFKKVLRMRNDLQMAFDRRINILDLNVLMILLKDGTDEFESFLNTFGIKTLYLQIFEFTNKVLADFDKICENSKLFAKTHPFGFIVRVVAGYFLRHFKLVHGKYNFYEPKYMVSLVTKPDEFYNVVEIN